MISRLLRFAWLRRLGVALRLHKLANWWLEKHPIVRSAASGVVYRAARLESIPLAQDVFSQYVSQSISAGSISTFIDLGCNVGYFTVWLAAQAREQPIRGLLFDANQDAMKEARWHVQANRLESVYCVHGLVGAEGATAEFQTYESNICSTTVVPEILRQSCPGQWKTVRVPCVKVGEHWHRHFGNTRCNLLKVDIEGSELDFLRLEESFLELVDAILVEWHKWSVTFEQLHAFCSANGFGHCEILSESSQMGVAVFRRRGIHESTMLPGSPRWDSPLVSV